MVHFCSTQQLQQQPDWDDGKVTRTDSKLKTYNDIYTLYIDVSISSNFQKIRQPNSFETREAKMKIVIRANREMKTS
jgi:hypothetical protein